MPSRTLEIVLNGKNNLGPVVDEATKDLKRIKESADLTSKAITFGFAVGAAKSAFLGLESIIRGIDGDFKSLSEAVFRLPFGIGEAARAAHSLWEAMTGADKAAERLEQRKLREKLAAEGEQIGKALDERSTFGTGNKRYESYKQMLKDIEDAEKAYRQRNYRTRDEEFEAYNDYHRRLREARDNDAKRLVAINERERADARQALVKRLDEEHRIEADKHYEAIVKRNEREKEARQQQIEIQKRAQQEQDEQARYNFLDYVESLRDKTQLSGLRAGTVSATGPTSRLQGFAADAETRRSQEQAELLKIQREHNEKLDNLIRVNERSGGQLERIFGLVGNL